MFDTETDSKPSDHPDPPEEARRPCPAPANFKNEVESYEARAETGRWQGPRYRMTYRVLGDGPPIVLVPGIASSHRLYALTLNRLAERFRTVLYDYPGENPGDGARLGRIGHDDLVDDVFGLLGHLNIGRAYLLGLSFGSTVTLQALSREPRRFPKAVVQGAFARRRFSPAERLALKLGRLVPGTTGRLPLREAVLTYNNRMHFPDEIADRWAYYLEQNAMTPIAPLAHRVDLLARLDLRAVLKAIPTEILLLQGNEDRVVPRRYFDELCAGLPNAKGVIMPLVGHLPHLTHGEGLAQAVTDWCLPCAPGGCPNEPPA